jgi:hypothetical protein
MPKKSTDLVKAFVNKGIEDVAWSFTFPELQKARPGTLRIKVTAESITLSCNALPANINRLMLRHGPQNFLQVDFSPLASSGVKWKDCAKYKEKVRTGQHHNMQLRMMRIDH